MILTNKTFFSKINFPPLYTVMCKKRIILFFQNGIFFYKYMHAEPPHSVSDKQNHFFSPCKKRTFGSIVHTLSETGSKQKFHLF